MTTACIVRLDVLCRTPPTRTSSLIGASSRTTRHLTIHRGAGRGNTQHPTPLFALLADFLVVSFLTAILRGALLMCVLMTFHKKMRAPTATVMTHLPSLFISPTYRYSTLSLKGVGTSSFSSFCLLLPLPQASPLSLSTSITFSSTR